jgi:hypothetical protein
MWVTKVLLNAIAFGNILEGGGSKMTYWIDTIIINRKREYLAP